MLARTLLARPKVILAEEPTQGVDAGARVEIYQILRDAADQGAAVVILSSDGVELEGLCDRVLIMSRGQVVKELVGDEVTEEGIAHAALTSTTSRIEVVDKERRSSGFRKWLRGDQSPAAVLGLIVVALAIAVGAMNSRTSPRSTSAACSPRGAADPRQVRPARRRARCWLRPRSVRSWASSWCWDRSGSSTAATSGSGSRAGARRALLVGFVNGFLSSRFNISPVVVTLATYMALQGAFLALRPVPGGLISSGLTDIVNFRIGMIPVAFVVAVVIALLLEWCLRRTRWGLKLRGYGSDAVAAERLGIPVRRVQMMSYVLASLLVLPAALIMMAQVGIGDGRPSLAYTLSSVTVLVLAGASIFGGRGSFAVIIVAAILVQQVINAMPFFGLTQEWSYLLPGLITVAAAIFYAQLRRARS